MKSMILQVNDVKLGVEQRGETQTSAPTLVMLHGFTGSAAGWSTQIELLSPMACASSPLTCLATDNPISSDRGATPLNTAGKISWQRYISWA